jgi:hypothetical protein
MSHKYSVVCNSVNSYTTATTTVTNNFFTTPTITTNNYVPTTVPTGWSSTAGVYQCNGTIFVNSVTAGITQYIMLQNEQNIYQDVTFPTAGYYKMSYYAAPRKGLIVYNTTQNLTITVNNVTAVNAQTFTPIALSTFALYTVDFLVNIAGLNRVTINTNAGVGDTSICFTGLTFSLYRSCLTYKMDWSFLPLGDYKMTYSFSSNQSTTSATTILLVIDDLGIIEKNYTGGNKTAAYISSVIGYINSNTFKTSLIANYKYNSPVYCRTPTNNIFTVKLYTYDGSALYALTSDYILTLCFEEI